MILRLAAAVFLTLAGVGQSAAQTPAQTAADLPPDWEVLRNPAKRSTMAFISFTSGLTMATRCTGQSFSALVHGLPPATRGQQTRILRIAVGDGALHDTRWNVTTDPTAAVADLPAIFARKLRNGGRLQIVVPDGAGPGRNLRHDVVMPASPVAIDETLTACDRPLVDPRDDDIEVLSDNGLPANVSWASRPRPIFPMGSRYAAGFAVVTCLGQPDGRLKDCVIETEHPDDGLFGAAVLRSMDRARVRSDIEPEGQIRPRLMSVRVNFRMD